MTQCYHCAWWVKMSEYRTFSRLDHADIHDL
jgi:hypothetical protein